MSALLFSPHNDDETLFAFYQCLRHRPHVYIVLRSYRQWVEQNGPHYRKREAETACAMEIAGCEWTQWEMPDGNPAWQVIAEQIDQVLQKQQPETVIYPAWELGGHEDHNALASIVHGIEGPWQHVRYATYQRGYGRTKGLPVVPDLHEQEAKLKALLCYESQINHTLTQDWFPGGAYHTLDEWLA